MLDSSVIPKTNEAPPQMLGPKMIEEMKASQAKIVTDSVPDVFATFNGNATPIADALQDPDPEAPRPALTILVDLANVRDRLRRLAAHA